MHKLTKIFSVIVTSVALSLGMATSALAGGLYIGAGAYQADSDVDDDVVPAVFLGYTFIDTNLVMLSGELGYYDLGEGSNETFKIESSAITAAGVVAIPITPFFELYAKAGIASIALELKTATEKYDDDGEEAFYGVGVSFDILDTIDIYAEYLAFDTSVDSELMGVGIKFAF
jgi:hypothetical protein